ncbi:MAG: hypothetical protein JXR30_00635 [Alphaproteobacteria bacterium]|nr:hypothetical protein [Alphaproteobacteria bacterium]
MHFYRILPSSVEKFKHESFSKIKKTSKGYFWFHKEDKSEESLKIWFSEHYKLSKPLVGLLTQSRSRITAEKNGLFLILKGFRLNKKKDIEDLVPIRIWMTEKTIITTVTEPVQSLNTVAKELETQKNIPQTPTDLLIRFLDLSLKYFETLVEKMEDSLESLEDHLLSRKPHEIDVSQKISDIRRLSLIFTNHFRPQSETLHMLGTQKYKWVNAKQQEQFLALFHTTDHVIETLNNLLSRASVIHDELDAQSDKERNRQNYILSVVATLFLPITFVTGLFGMNVGGVPYSMHPYGFAGISFILILTLLIVLLVLKKAKWV